MKNLFDFMATASPAERVDGVVEPLDDSRTPNTNIQLDQCLQDFKQSETLDEDNKWFCNKCKDHV